MSKSQMGKKRHLVLPLLTVIFAASVGYMQLSWVAALVFTVAFGGGLALYMATIWRVPFDARTVLVPYLLTVIFFIVHVYEEYLTEFWTLLTTITGQEVSQGDFLFVAAFTGPILWIAGAILILMRTHYGDYFLCAFFFAMVIAELAHFIFPFAEHGHFHYSSGLYTAAVPLIPAGYGLYIMLRSVHHERRKFEQIS